MFEFIASIWKSASNKVIPFFYMKDLPPCMNLDIVNFSHNITFKQIFE